MHKDSWLKQLTLCIALTSLCFTVPLALSEGLATRKDYALSAEIGKNNQKSLWDLLFGQKRGRGGSRTPFCSIWPNLNDPDLLVIWSDRPLFVWKGIANVKRIEVRIANRESTLFWSHDVTEKEQKEQSVLYPADSDALKPGQEYNYSVEYETVSKNSQGEVIKFSEKEPSIPFRIMDAQERLRIKAELEALESQNRNMSAEEKALQRAKYFAQQSVWSDVIQEIFLLQNPSADSTSVINKIRTDPTCTIKLPNLSANITYQGLPTIVKLDQ